MECRYNACPKRKARTILLAGKIIGTIFYDAEGYILVDFLPQKGNCQYSSLVSNTPETMTCTL
jgi:hypothetical protein